MIAVNALACFKIPATKCIAVSLRPLSVFSSKKEVTKTVSKPKGKLSFNENREFGLLENYIAKLEKKKTHIEHQFANNEITPEEINEKSQELEKIIFDLEQKEERWLELSMKLEG